MNLEVIDTSADPLRLRLSGRLDTLGAREIENRFLAIVESVPRNLLVDFAEVSFMASMGIRLLVQAAARLRPHQARLVLLTPGPQVREVLQLAGMSGIVDCAADEREGLALLATAGIDPTAK